MRIPASRRRSTSRAPPFSRRAARLLRSRLGAQAAIPPADRSANAAARIADSVMASPSSSATSRPDRITSTRCASPRISSSSDEMRTIAMPARPAIRAARRSRASRRRRRRGSARRRAGPAARRAACARTGPSAGCRRRACSRAPVARAAHVAAIEHPAGAPTLGRRMTTPRRLSSSSWASVVFSTDGAAEDQPLVLPRLGDHRHAGVEAPSRASAERCRRRRSGASLLDAVRAEDRARELGRPAPTRPAMPDDLAARTSNDAFATPAA